VQQPVNSAISEETRPITFITDNSNIITSVLIKRKAEICTQKDRLKEGNIDFLID